MKKLLIFLGLFVSLSLFGQGMNVMHTTHRVIAVAGGGLYPAPSTLSDTDSCYAWYQKGDFTETGSGVSNWNDATNNQDLTQATDANRPPASGDTITLGANDQLSTGLLYNLPQPYYVYAIVRQNTWTSGRQALRSAAGGQQLANLTSTPRIAAFSGDEWTLTNDNMTLGTWFVLRYFVAGTDSKTQINATTASTGDMDAAVANGYILGNSGGAADWSFLEVIIMQTNIAYNEDSIYNYLYDRLPE